MRKIRIIKYDGYKGKGVYVDSDTLDKKVFTYTQLVDGKIELGNFAWIDDLGQIFKRKKSWWEKLIGGIK